jgi:hypothetical protein
MGQTSYNPLNQWEGRVGGIIYKVINGKQVMMPYSKSVFNPRTTAQMVARAKFSLSAMISKIVPKEVLIGMSSDRRKRRSLFLSNIVRHTTVAVTPEGYIASLDAEDLVFSTGEYSPVTISDVSVADGLVNATISKKPNAVDTVMVIAVVYDTNIGQYTHTVYDFLPAGETTICLDTETTAAGNVAHLYAVPMSLTQLGRNLSGSSDGAERSANNGFSYTMMLTTTEGTYTYGRSQYLSTIELGDGSETPGGGENQGGNENQNENSQNTQTDTVAAPTISGNTSFTDTSEVTITGPAEAEIRYTTDGSTPTAESSLYSEALTLSETTTVKAIAIKNGVSSTVASKTFTKGSGGGSGLGDTN